MDTLFSRYRNAMVLVAVLFLQLVMLAFQVKRDRDMPLVRIWAVALITPVEKVSSSAIRGVLDIWYNYFDLRGAREQNRRLVEELGRLKVAHQHVQEEALEGRRLRELIEFRGRAPFATVAARVIGSSASETSRVLFLDKGSEAGLRPNMPVVTPEGIVGKVHRVFWGSAQVLVITDPDSGVAVMLDGSRVHAALRGSGGFFCRLNYIVNDEKVAVGDRVITSGEDLIYPKGLPIGAVSAVQPGPVFKEITVEPSARLSRLEEVLVIVRGVEQEAPGRPAPGVAQAPPAPVGSSPAPAPPGAGTAISAAGAATRSRPETEADKLLQAYRAQALKVAAQKAPVVRPPGSVESQPRPAPARPGETPAAASAPKPAPSRPAEQNAPAPEKPAEKPAEEPTPRPQPPPQPPPR